MNFSFSRSDEETPKNQYVLTINYMHGDADLYTDGQLVTDTADQMKQYLALLEPFADFTSAATSGGSTEGMSVVVAALEELGFDFEYNASYQDHFAVIEGWQLVHYDDQGVKWDVEITP